MIAKNAARLTVTEKRAHLASFRERYSFLGRREKGLLIDEACALLKWDRKHAIKALNGKACKGGIRKPYSREKTYGEDIRDIVLDIWRQGGMPCGPRLRAMIPLWLDFYETSGGTLDDRQRKKLLKCSVRTLQNLTAGHRPDAPPKHGIAFRITSHRMKTGTEGIPSPWEPELAEWITLAPSHPESRASSKGAFLESLTVTDTMSGWRELAEVRVPQGSPANFCFGSIREALPFELPARDGGRTSNFVHESLGNWLAKGIDPQTSCASRLQAPADCGSGLAADGQPGGKALTEIVAELYRSAWLPLRNHFLPVMKTVSKVRIGDTRKSVFDQPASPYQRLLASGALDPVDEKSLRDEHARLNPFELAAEVSRHLQVISHAVEDLGIPKSS